MAVETMVGDDGVEQRRCRSCGLFKYPTAFKPRFLPSGNYSYSGECKFCRNAKQRAAYKADPSKQDAANKKCRRKRLVEFKRSPPDVTLAPPFLPKVRGDEKSL